MVERRLGVPLACVVAVVSTSCLTKSNPYWNSASTESGQQTTTVGTSTTSTTSTSGAGVTTDGGTSGGATTTQPTTTGGVDSGSSTSGAATTGGGDPCDFFDDFERPNGDDLGNDWIEKNPLSFRIEDGRLVYQSAGSTYFNGVWYRPLDVLCDDVEVSVEVHLSVEQAVGFPQVDARVQPGTVEQGLDAYICFLENGAELRLRRNRTGMGTMDLDIVPFADTLNSIDDYRLRMRVSGTDPVEIDCFWEVFEVDGWVVQASINATDAEPERITGPGTFGGSSNIEPIPYTYDNYRAVGLP